jgi:hypothetical protein
MKSSTIALLALVAYSSAAYAESRPATKAQIELVREAMQERLKDADSAKFRNVRFGSGDNKGTICGDVNAKNSFGAYGGFVSFMAAYISPDDYTDSATVKHKASVLIIGVDDEPGGAAAQLCAQKGI